PRDSVPRAKEAAMRALRIDDTLAEPHAALGYLKTNFDWDWSGAEKEFKRALELSPTYATAHQWYSLHLQESGRTEEAIAEARRAQDADPLSLIITSVTGRTLFFARRYEQAIRELQKAIEMDSTFPRAHWFLAIVYSHVGRHDEAILECQKALS